MQTFFKQASFILHIIKFLLFTEPHSIKHVVHVHGHSQHTCIKTLLISTVLTEQTNFNSHIVTRLYMIPVTRL